MNSRVFLLLVFALICGFGMTSWAAQQPIDGDWEGVAKLPGDDMRLTVGFKTETGNIKGTFEIPDSGYLPKPPSSLVNISAKDSHIHFEIPKGGGVTVPYDGEISGDTISGTFQNGKFNGAFTLKRITPKPPPYKEEEVSFQSGNVTLAGSLFIPDTKGQHPALVFHHGGRANDRNVWRFFADYFARRGIACLIYDNRSAGNPQGINVLSFDELAKDPLAGVEFLKSRPEINPQRIGLAAGSQGAWITPLAAARSKDVAFLLLISTPGVTQANNIQYEAEMRLRDKKFSEDEIKRALDYKRKVSALLVANEPDDKINTLLETIKNEKWFDQTGFSSPTSAWRPFFRLTLAYDPIPVWEKIKIPVLLIYGELDKNVRVAESAPLIERALKKAGNRNVTVKIVPGADHGINVLTPQGRPHRTTELMDFMTDWLLKRART